MKLITADEMAVADENSEYLGVRRLQLMENAGRSVAEYVKDHLGSPGGKELAVICGTGNNGGDGFVAARHLAGDGAKLLVFLLGVPDKIGTEEASTNWRALTQMHQSITLSTLAENDFMDKLTKTLPTCDIIVDAIFGTGVRGPIREPWKSAIQAINSSGKHVIAVDIPSGLDPTTGEASDLSVRASSTVTFHKLKPGLLKRPDLAGSVLVKSIGLPSEAELIMGPGDLRQAIREFCTRRERIGAATIALFSYRASEVENITKLARALTVGVRHITPGGPSILSPNREESNEPITLFMNLGGKDRPSSHLVEESLGDESRKILLTGSYEALSATRSKWEGNPGVSLLMDQLSLENLSGVSISARENLTEKLERLKAVCKALRKTIFVSSDVDLASDGETCKANWRAMSFFGVENREWVFYAVSTTLVSHSVKPLSALSASSFVARGGARTLEPVEISFNPENIVSILRGYGLQT